MRIDVYTWAFHELKMRLTKAPILVPPDWTKEFQVYLHASNFTIGNFLSQKNEKSFDHPIFFANGQWVATKLNYITIKRKVWG
jgi:hypothetical protein